MEVWFLTTACLFRRWIVFGFLIKERLAIYGFGFVYIMDSKNVFFFLQVGNL